MLERSIAPEIKDAVEFDLKLKPHQHFILKNGVEVFAIDAGAQDLIQLEWVFFAGNSVELQHGVAAATNSLLKNGTKTKTAFQINEHFDYYGAYCNRSCYNETATISLHTLNKHLSKLLPVLSEMITECVFPEEELEILKQNSKQKLSVNLQKSDFVANRLIDAEIYGMQHPYGSYTVAADYDKLTVDLLRAHYQKHYASGKCVMFVAGKLPDDIQLLLDQHFGHLPLSNHRPFYESIPMTFEPYTVSKKQFVTNDPNGVQGAIRMARPFPNRQHPDYTKVMVLNTLFGGYFGSRLMTNIREDKGYTYGIHSYVQNHIGNSCWVISTEAGRDVCEAAVAEVYKEMNILKSDLVDEDELMLVRNYLMGIILGDLDGPFQIIGRWKSIVLNNLTDQYFYDSINTIKHISAEELRALSNVYLNPSDFCELIVV
jgi:predicted Zn-dependent peptidase